jgi:hypothetical protein
MSSRDQALDGIDGAPAHFASGEPPQPACPCCGHIRGVQPLAAILPPPRRNPYGPLFTIFRTDFYRADAFGQSPLVTGGWRSLGIAPPAPPERRAFARTLHPPRRPWTMGQAVDQRLTVVIDLAFLGLVLFLVGRLIRAVELVTLAALLGALAILVGLWFIVALATGQFRHVNGAAQDRYQRAERRWRALLYCEDCGSVFRRDGRGYLSPQGVPAYLERDGADTLPLLDEMPVHRR